MNREYNKKVSVLILNKFKSMIFYVEKKSINKCLLDLKEYLISEKKILMKISQIYF